MTGLRTIRQGDRVAVWDTGGRVRFVDGPKRLWLFRETVELLDRYSAKADQYIVIQHTDGSTQHIAGPAVVWYDPVEHKSVKVRDQVSVGADQAVVIYKREGEEQVDRRVLHGPAQFMPKPDEQWHSVKPGAHYNAGADEYLVLNGVDGSARHIKGPADTWFNPIEHESVEIRPLVPLDANESVVIYQRGDGDEVRRRVLRGPAHYMPEPEEWLHEFVWHGSDKKNPRKKVPYALRFTKLRVIPDQTYIDVKDVRTADDALLTVQAMVFFELIDIEQMLDQTHDPIADFINAVTADVIDFAATRQFNAFKRDTDKLSELESYPNLLSRAERIGYRINKVVYRGYEANPKLQAMHDDAIEARTSLQLQAETERQAQELADLKLAREADRAKQQREIEREQTEHEQRLNRLAHSEVLRQQAEDHQQAVDFKKELNTLELEHEHAKNAEQSAYLKSMQEMQVDLTRYLVSQYQHPDRLIRIDGQPERSTQLHLHDE